MQNLSIGDKLVLDQILAESPPIVLEALLEGGIRDSKVHTIMLLQKIDGGRSLSLLVRQVSPLTQASIDYLRIKYDVRVLFEILPVRSIEFWMSTGVGISVYRNDRTLAIAQDVLLCKKRVEDVHASMSTESVCFAPRSVKTVMPYVEPEVIDLESPLVSSGADTIVSDQEVVTKIGKTEVSNLKEALLRGDYEIPVPFKDIPLIPVTPVLKAPVSDVVGAISKPGLIDNFSVEELTGLGMGVRFVCDPFFFSGSWNPLSCYKVDHTRLKIRRFVGSDRWVPWQGSYEIKADKFVIIGPCGTYAFEFPQNDASIYSEPFLVIDSQSLPVDMFRYLREGMVSQGYRKMNLWKGSKYTLEFNRWRTGVDAMRHEWSTVHPQVRYNVTRMVLPCYNTLFTHAQWSAAKVCSLVSKMVPRGVYQYSKKRPEGSISGWRSTDRLCSRHGTLIVWDDFVKDYDVYLTPFADFSPTSTPCGVCGFSVMRLEVGTPGQIVTNTQGGRSALDVVNRYSYIPGRTMFCRAAACSLNKKVPTPWRMLFLLKGTKEVYFAVTLPVVVASAKAVIATELSPEYSVEGVLWKLRVRAPDPTDPVCVNEEVVSFIGQN
jgi:hypothetical protein